LKRIVKCRNQLVPVKSRNQLVLTVRRIRLAMSQVQTLCSTCITSTRRRWRARRCLSVCRKPSPFATFVGRCATRLADQIFRRLPCTEKEVLLQGKVLGQRWRTMSCLVRHASSLLEVLPSSSPPQFRCRECARKRRWQRKQQNQPIRKRRAFQRQRRSLEVLIF